MEGETCFYTFVKTKLSVAYTALPSRYGPPAQEGDHVQEDKSRPLSGPPLQPFPERPFLQCLKTECVVLWASSPLPLPPAMYVPTWVDFKVDVGV